VYAPPALGLRVYATEYELIVQFAVTVISLLTELHTPVEAVNVPPQVPVKE